MNNIIIRILLLTFGFSCIGGVTYGTDTDKLYIRGGSNGTSEETSGETGGETQKLSKTLTGEGQNGQPLQDEKNILGGSGDVGLLLENTGQKEARYGEQTTVQVSDGGNANRERLSNNTYIIDNTDEGGHTEVLQQNHKGGAGDAEATNQTTTSGHQTSGQSSGPTANAISNTKPSGLSKILACDFNSRYTPKLDYMEAGKRGGQCGKYVNTVLGNYSKGKHFGNYLEQKKTFINSQTPVAGSVMIVDTGHKRGHVGIVKTVYDDGKILVNDSNLVATETVGEYIIDPKNPKPPKNMKFDILGYYVPYDQFYDVVIDRDGNGKIYRDTGSDVKIGLIGNHGKPPTINQLQKTRDTVLSNNMKAYELETNYCTKNFHTGMLRQEHIDEMKIKPKAQPKNNTRVSPTGAISEKMYFTHYDLGDVAQNDSTPCIGAAGNDMCKFTRNGGRGIALVRPKRDQYGIKFRDKVLLKGDPGCTGVWTVLDEMNKRYRRMPDSACIKRPGTDYCIRGDVAAYGSFQPAGGACYIAEIYPQ